MVFLWFSYGFPMEIWSLPAKIRLPIWIQDLQATSSIPPLGKCRPSRISSVGKENSAKQRFPCGGFTQKCGDLQVTMALNTLKIFSLCMFLSNDLDDLRAKHCGYHFLRDFHGIKSNFVTGPKHYC